MSKQEKADVDDIVQMEMRAVATELFEEIWQEGLAEHLDVQLLAQVFIEQSLKQVASERGEAFASQLVSHFKELDDMGFLPQKRSLQ